MDLNLALTQSGLTGNEAKIYLALLQNGSLGASTLAKKTNLDRSLTYTVLENLINKGLVSFSIINNKKHFCAEPPETLLNPLKEKELMLTNIISELNEITVEEKTDYEIKLFEGKEGIRTVMNMILKAKKASSFGGTGRAYDLLYDLQAQVKNLKADQLNVRILFSKDFKHRQITELAWVKTKHLDIQSEVTTTIFQNYVAIHLIKAKPFIILIKNKEIARSYQNHFEILWNQGKN